MFIGLCLDFICNAIFGRTLTNAFVFMLIVIKFGLWVLA